MLAILLYMSGLAHEVFTQKDSITRKVMQRILPVLEIRSILSASISVGVWNFIIVHDQNEFGPKGGP